MDSRRTFLQSAGFTVGSLAGVGRASRAQASDSPDQKSPRETITGSFVTFYQEIPDEPRERFAGVWESSKGIVNAANLVLSQVPTIDEVADLEDFSEPIMGLLRNVTENLEEAYDIRIKTKYLDDAVRAAGYLPLVAQIWNVLQSSLNVLNVAGSKQQFLRKVHRPNAEKAVEQFYISLLLLFTELVFLASGFGYRTAFGTTRRAANLGLVRLRGRVGLRAYSVLLSIVHWLVRGSVETTASYIVEKAGEVAQELSISGTDFSRLSKEEISAALPQKSSTSFLNVDLGDYLPLDNEAASAAESYIDSSHKKALIEIYDGSGIIEAKDANRDGWIFWN